MLTSRFLFPFASVSYTKMATERVAKSFVLMLLKVNSGSTLDALSRSRSTKISSTGKFSIEKMALKAQKEGFLEKSPPRIRVRFKLEFDPGRFRIRGRVRESFSDFDASLEPLIDI